MKRLHGFPRIIMGQRVVVRVVDEAAASRLRSPDGWVNTLRASAVDLDEGADAALAETRAHLMAFLDARPRLQLAAEVAGPGYVEAFIWGPGDLQAELAQAVSDRCDVEVAARPDPEARVFFEFLAPSAIERLWIENRRQLARVRPHLAASQDAARARLAHRLGFSSKDSRARFADEMARRGFELEYPFEDPEDGADEDLMLTLLRTEPLDVAHLDDITQRLFKRAAACAGRYQGWEFRA